MTDKTQDFEQLSLPLVGERKPTRAATMRNAQHSAENVQKAKAALRAAALRKQTGVDQAKSAIRAAKRVRQQQLLVDQG